MNTIAPLPPPPPVRVRPPELHNGDHLGASEFWRRYQRLPKVKKAELIQGIVLMASPTRTDTHADPDGFMLGLLFTYASANPGVKSSANGTVKLGPDDIVQPDSSLRRLPEAGGRARVDAEGYLVGAPELVVEIAASSVSIDCREKKDSYRRAGVNEYLVWRTEDNAIDAWMLVEETYEPLLPEPDGTVRSRVFPGLWFDLPALLAGDAARALGTLQNGIHAAQAGRA